MIIEFEDACWSIQDDDWNRSLIELLALLTKRSQHAVLALPQLMLDWCNQYLILHNDYFKTRLAMAQVRSNSVRIIISPDGAAQVTNPPPWTLTPMAAYSLIEKPLRLVLENDQSDKMFVESTIPAFAKWCHRGWIDPAMGGGSAMQGDIEETANDAVARWRTFYLFDSDRLHPNELDSNWTPPSGDGCQGYIFELACNNMPSRRWHRLNRRSIENYLPEHIITTKDSAAASILFDSSVAEMAHFYNYKKGLSGDGVYPSDAKKTIRAARSSDFWNTLTPTALNALQNGFGKKIADEFNNVSSNHPWPENIITEMNTLSDALQDAI